jgi:hypothetical protein
MVGEPAKQLRLHKRSPALGAIAGVPDNTRTLREVVLECARMRALERLSCSPGQLGENAT